MLDPIVDTEMSSESWFMITTVAAVRALKLFDTLMYCLDMFSEGYSSNKHFPTLLTLVSLTPVRWFDMLC